MPKKNKGGRPTKKNESILGKLEEGFKSDFTIVEACAYAGINPDTYHEWYTRDKVFSERMDRAKLFLFHQAKKNIAIAISSGEVEDSWKLLRSRQKDIYSERQENLNASVDLNQLLEKFEDYEEATGQFLHQDEEGQKDKVQDEQGTKPLLPESDEPKPNTQS
jgi:hypothetical protein